MAEWKFYISLWATFSDGSFQWSSKFRQLIWSCFMLCLLLALPASYVDCGAGFMQLLGVSPSVLFACRFWDFAAVAQQPGDIDRLLQNQLAVVSSSTAYSTAYSSKCGQCHVVVVSQGTQLNTDLWIMITSGTWSVFQLKSVVVVSWAARRALFVDEKCT